MIRRLKRQTKHRHSVKRDYPGIASRGAAKRLAEQTLRDLSSTRVEFAPVEPIIGSKFSPDVWAR